jgi:hypothetical protein
VVIVIKIYQVYIIYRIYKILLERGRAILRRYNNQLYYNIREAGMLINRSRQTIYKWIQDNEKMIDRGEQPIIPVPTIIDGVKCFSQNDIKYIKKEMAKFKKGLFKEYRAVNTYQKLKLENEELKKKIKELKEVKKNETD